MDLQHGAFAEADHPDIRVDLDEFLDALFAGFPGMAFRMGVEVMRIDLEGDQVAGVEPDRVDDGLPSLSR